MRSQDQIGHDEKLWQNLENIQESSGLSHEFISDALNFTPEKYTFHRVNRLGVSFNSVKKFSDKVGISMESLLDKELSKSNLYEALRVNSLLRIPNRYRVGNGSRSFTVRHILDLAKKYGLLKEIQDKFGLGEMSFENKIDFDLSVQLPADILDYISSKVTLTDQDFLDMSRYNAFYFKDTYFGQELSRSKDVLEAYEKLFEVVTQVEDNWSYKIISADDKRIVINSYSNERLSDIYKNKSYSSYNFSRFRASMASHIVNYVGQTGAHAKLTKSIHFGSDFDQFEISFNNLRPLFSETVRPC